MNLRDNTNSFSFIAALVLLPLVACDRKSDVKSSSQKSFESHSGSEAFLGQLMDILGWRPEDFFSSRQHVELCKVMSSHSPQDFEVLLRGAIDSGIDLNLAGKSGITLLFWAFAENCMTAFQLLLENGADPDMTLTERLPAENYDVFWEGDSVMFTSLRAAAPRYCVAALPYSKCVPNCVDRQGYTLLATYLYYGFASSEQVLQALIDTGINLDESGGMMGPPLLVAFSLGHNPLLALRLLESGADPTVVDGRGEDIVDLVERRLVLEKQRDIHDERLDPLIAWLNENYRNVRRNRSFQSPQATE